MFRFSERKKAEEAARCLRRLCELTTPNLAAAADSQNNPPLRSENRYNRTIPALLCPWRNKQALIDDCSWAVTKDIADRGLGLVMPAPWQAEQAVLGFWLSAAESERPWFLLANARRQFPIGGGYWLLGFEVIELLGNQHREQLDKLLPLAAELLPPVAAEV